MSVREMLARVDSKELTEWAAFEQLEPFGEQREDLRTGLVCATVANFSLNPPKKPHRPSDYMLFVERTPSGPVLLKDPKAQADLLRQALFGVRRS